MTQTVWAESCKYNIHRQRGSSDPSVINHHENKSHLEEIQQVLRAASAKCGLK